MKCGQDLEQVKKQKVRLSLEQRRLRMPKTCYM